MGPEGFGEETEPESDMKEFLREYLGIEETDAERINLLKTKDLPQPYQEQLEFFGDERLNEVTVAVVPDDIWHKGSQPSESDGEKQLIIIRQGYFESLQNTDETAWLCHELAHCQAFLESESPVQYEDNMKIFAFEDLKTDYPYPNNPVERFTFTRQFQYLKRCGKSRADVLKMIGGYYEKEDMPFFDRLLDAVYGEDG